MTIFSWGPLSIAYFIYTMQISKTNYLGLIANILIATLHYCCEGSLCRNFQAIFKLKYFASTSPMVMMVQHSHCVTIPHQRTELVVTAAALPRMLHHHHTKAEVHQTSQTSFYYNSPWQWQMLGPSVTTSHVHYIASKTVLNSQWQEENPIRKWDCWHW